MSKIVDLAPKVIEGPGRYKVFESPNGDWVLARTVELCERCQECGCGEKAEPVTIPGLIVKMAAAQGKGLLGKLKGMTQL